MKDKLIWCDTKEKLKKVAQKLKDDGFSITDAETIWRSYGAESVLSVHAKEKCITYCSRDWYEMRDYETPITADKFLGKSKNPSIVIFRRGRNVIAKDVATGNEGIAKCSPNDEFCFKTGASIALARLMAKTPEALNHDVKDEWIKALGLTPVEKKVYTDADRNFKVGDRVVVRDWDDMASEYPVEDGNIVKDSVSACFSAYMKHLCGRTATVTAVGNDGGMRVEFDDKSGSTSWFYKTWMFNPINANKSDDGKIHEGDTVKVVNTGLNYSSYPQWVGEHISDPYMAARYCYNSPNTESKYKVIKIAEHENNGRMLAYIEECDGLGHNKCYLIEVKGLVKV